MSHHHGHSGPEGHQHGEPAKSRDRALHRDWRIWLAVGLMLFAMVIYIITQGESVWPFGGPSGIPSATATNPAAK